jgi:primosomal replication protein N
MKNTDNRIVVSGMITSAIKYDFSTHGERFFRFYLISTRLSGETDTVPCIIPEILINHITSDVVELVGEIHTRNVHRKDGTSKLDIFLFVKEVGEYGEYDKNNGELIGYICKPPVYRKTPLGREIADVLIAANRAYGKSDYIPCIVWGRNARRVSTLGIGTKIKVTGRLQSRDYTKHISDTEFEMRTAYEFSVSKLIEEGEDTDESKKNNS